MENKILIIYAHPNTEGYNKEILRNVLSHLNKKNKEYKLLDLYHMNFNPVLDQDELIIKGGVLSTDTLKFQKDISEHNKLIFIYPIWWGSMPAILKGFADKVFSQGFAYKYVNGRPKGLLKNKEALVFSTSGAPDFYNFLTCKKFTKRLTKDVLSFCGIKSKSKIIGNALDIDKKDEREKVKNIVLKELDSFL